MHVEAALERLFSTIPTRRPPADGARRLEVETIVPAPLDETFGFFADASNLERLTPDWLRFEIRTPRPIAMREGTEIRYRIRWHGVPIPWTTVIEVWQPGVRFVDRQVAGPYRWWRHEHRFDAVPGGTRVVDLVEFAAPLPLVSGRIVASDVARIFEYRRRRLAEIFAPPR